MSKNIVLYIKQHKSECFFAALSFALFSVFTVFLNFFIIQADDYYYASFFKNGLFDFFRLSVDHFLRFNGRALVHFFAQTALALPHFLTAALSSAVMAFIGVLSYRILNGKFEKKSLFCFMNIFYSFILFFGSDIFKEGIMWISAFYNYVFPLLILLFAVKTKDKPYGLIFCFLSGATTEQWGITAFSVLFVLCFSDFEKKRRKNLISSISPLLCNLLGYGTIFLSPATSSRITLTAHATLPTALVDFPRLCEVFMSIRSSFALFIIFILANVALAFKKGESYRVLFTGLLPLVLIFISFFTESTLVCYIVFMLYLILCAVFFYLKSHVYISSFLLGAVVSVLIMLPTNTFEARICTPTLLLLAISSVGILFLSKDTISSRVCVISVLIIAFTSAVFFSPTFTGFLSNSKVERENLTAVQNAKKTGVLYYNIDYDKSFAVKQMFNDGWFFNEFLSLYDLTDCRVKIKSRASVPLDKISSDALMINGELYAPVRDFLSSLGGTIVSGDDIIMTLNGKSITLTSGMLVYTDENGTTRYLVADENRIPNFYTLYLKLDVLNDAFSTNVKAL